MKKIHRPSPIRLSGEFIFNLIISKLDKDVVLLLVIIHCYNNIVIIIVIIIIL